jgi:hypothetical protein
MRVILRNTIGAGMCDSVQNHHSILTEVLMARFCGMRHGLRLPLQPALAHQAAQRERARVGELFARLRSLRQGLRRRQGAPVISTTSAATPLAAAWKEREIHRPQRRLVHPIGGCHTISLDTGAGEDNGIARM